MARKRAYEMSNDELLNDFTEAVMRAGVSGSGLIIDLSGHGNRQRAQFLQGIVMSRLLGEKPPEGWAPDVKIHLRGPAGRLVRSQNAPAPGFAYKRIQNDDTGTPYTVREIWFRPLEHHYSGMRNQTWSWQVELREFEREDRRFFFKVDEFELVPEKTTVPA